MAASTPQDPRTENRQVRQSARFVTFNRFVLEGGGNLPARARSETAPAGQHSGPPDDSDLAGLYIISVAARLLAMHPQTLRKYDRAGLVTPSRTVGMLRLYSDEDLSRLRVIRRLVDELGLNLAGASLVLGMAEVIAEIAGSLEQAPETAAGSAAGRLRNVLEYVGAA